MELSHVASKILIVGKSGTGKSTFFRQYIKRLGAQYVFLFDHQGEHGPALGRKSARTEEELERDASEGFCCFDPADMFEGQTSEAFNFFCQFTFECCKVLPGLKLFACDELQILTGTDKVPDEFSCVIETGRRYQLDAVLISQQPNLLHNRIRNQATEIVAFQSIDPIVLDYLQDYGFDPSEIQNLQPRGEYIVRNFQNGEMERGMTTAGV